MIVAFMGKCVNTYLEKCLLFLEMLDIECPICSSKTTSHGNYKRHVHEGDKTVWLSIYRVICAKCLITHAIIPDFIRPYKHYSACETELVLRDCEDGIQLEGIDTDASTSTVKRWVKEFKSRSIKAADTLVSILLSPYNKKTEKLDYNETNMFPILEQLLSLLPSQESSHLTISEVNQWLTKRMAGVFI